MGLVGISKENKTTNVHLLKNEPVYVNWWGDISNVILRWLKINPSWYGLDRFTLISMESSEQTAAYISSPLCTNRLIFGKGAFFYSVLLNMITNAIISNIWISVTSHLSSLLIQCCNNLWRYYTVFVTLKKNESRQKYLKCNCNM